MRPKLALFTLLLTLLGLLALFAFGRERAPAPQAPESHGPPPPQLIAEGSPSQADAPRPPNRAAAPAQNTADTSGTRDYGFCPDANSPNPGFSRVPLQSLLSTRASELMDRIQRMYRNKHGPPALRRALTTFLTDQSMNAVNSLKSIQNHFDDNFDLAAAAAITLGTQALGRSDLALAQRAARVATTLAPDDAASHVLAALVARRLGNQLGERKALTQAYRITPDEPTLALAMGQALSKTKSLDQAILALSAYLEAAPDDVTAGQQRARLRLQWHLHKPMTSTRSRGVTLLYPQQTMNPTRARALAQTIASALDEAAELTGLKTRRALLAVVYQDRADLIASTCVPNWTEGVFDGVLRLHAATLRDSKRMQRVVRHEAFHAQMGSVPMQAPHWLHEGAAQFFAHEMGPGHVRSYRFMTKHRTHIPFASMDGSFLVIEASSDARLAYHQSLAMVQMLVANNGGGALAEAVQFLRRGGDSHMLWGHMMKQHGDSDALLKHLRNTLVHLP